MQRYHASRPPVELTDSVNSPDTFCPSETEKVVPDSFAEWLAQPSQTISAGPEPEQGIFLGLMEESLVQLAQDPPSPPPSDSRRYN